MLKYLVCNFYPVFQSVFEKTCEATQKNVKSHVFLDFEKKTLKNVKKRTGRPTQSIVSQAT